MNLCESSDAKFSDKTIIIMRPHNFVMECSTEVFSKRPVACVQDVTVAFSAIEAQIRAK